MPLPPMVDAVAGLTRELIRAQSLSGQERQAGEVLGQALAERGFTVERDRYGNVIGCLAGRRPGPTVLLDGHLDTVPVAEPERWTRDPFGGEIADGRVYGRGASDMKGALAAMVVAAGYVARDTGLDFPGRICIAGVVHEECFEGIAAREVSAKLEPDYVIIGEASELNLKIGQRGRAEIVVQTTGKPAHSANPEQGVNAVLHMVKLVAALEKVTWPEHPVLGRGIGVLTDIISTPYPGASVVPSRCRATFDRRLLVGETPDSVLAPFRAAMAELADADPTFKAAVGFASGQEDCYTGAGIAGERFFPAWLFERDADFVVRSLAALREAGLPSQLSHYAFCTNASHYAGELGIPTLGFGPSRENLAHTTDEYVEIAQLEGAVTGYAAIIRALLELPVRKD